MSHDWYMHMYGLELSVGLTRARIKARRVGFDVAVLGIDALSGGRVERKQNTRSSVVATDLYPKMVRRLDARVFRCFTAPTNPKEEQVSEDQITIEEDDAFIRDAGRNGYSVSMNGRGRGWIASMDDAVANLVHEMRETNYFPNTWFINDHGNATLLLITIDEHPNADSFTWDFSDVSYV